MRNSLIISTFVLLLFTCNSQVNNTSVRFSPETKGIEKFDTVIANIQIIIKKIDLDTYVLNEYEDKGKKQIDKYRDAEISLIIKQNSQTLLDTVFRKNQFSKYADKGFMEIAIFHNYWFNKIDKERIELFGVINKPETDYTLPFYHYFDLKTKKLSFEEYIDNEE
ncbi:MAG: DUF4738 domain-containing protein [Crocinitomicaceae bacterium]